MIPEVKSLQCRGGLLEESALAPCRAASFPAYPRLGRQINLPQPEGDVAASADFMQGEVRIIHIALLLLLSARRLAATGATPERRIHMRQV